MKPNHPNFQAGEHAFFGKTGAFFPVSFFALFVILSVSKFLLEKPIPPRRRFRLSYWAQQMGRSPGAVAAASEGCGDMGSELVAQIKLQR